VSFAPTSNYAAFCWPDGHEIMSEGLHQISCRSWVFVVFIFYLRQGKGRGRLRVRVIIFHDTS